MKKPKKKMTLRGYQTALGIARREEGDLRRKLMRATIRADAAEEEHRLALINIQHLRAVMGEWCPPREKLSYRRACVVKVLDDRDFRPIPPMHIHVRENAPSGGCQHKMKYIFELALPDGIRLDYRTAHVVHSALHELVDFVEKNASGGCLRIDTFPENKKGVL